MADTLKQMYNAQPGAATWTTSTSYTVPTAGAVVRNIHISNGNSTTKYASVLVAPNNTGTTYAATDKHLLWQVPIPANSFINVGCSIVLVNGEFLRFLTEATGVTVTVSGVEL